MITGSQQSCFDDSIRLYPEIITAFLRLLPEISKLNLRE
jgi:hypothetical protein